MLKLRENVLELLDSHNYFDNLIIFDTDGRAVYYDSQGTSGIFGDIDVVGKTLSELYPGVDPEESVIMKAIREGTPTYNLQETTRVLGGRQISHVITVLPIIENGQVTGAVEATINTAVDTRHNIYITPETGRRHRQLYTTEDIISENPLMRRVKEKITKVSRTDSPVMIYGKTGTGKEMVAEAIHTGSARRGKPFMAQNCAAIPANLLESMLFGTVRGSFTGAEDKKGLLEAASGGTVFLDEINNMDMALQAKILKALEEQKIMRVGDYEQRPIDVRIVAATNEDPLLLVRKHLLREDLYYRLRVIQIDLPALAERQSDIPLLTEYFINKYNKLMHRNIAGVDKDMMDFLLRREWKGNIRELENTIECAFNFAEGAYLTLDDLPWLEQETEAGEGYEHFDVNDDRTLKELLQEYECEAIREALTAAGGDVRKAADMLGLTRQNLHHKLKQYRLE